MLIHSGHYFVAFLFYIGIGIQQSHEELIGLYEDTDLMEILDSSNFNDKVINANTSYVIEFYNAYCGHCIRFSGPWKEFGLEVYGWRNYVKVGVIDCSNELNSQTCRNYEIMAYPTVRYFPPHPAPNDVGIEFLRSNNVQRMKNFLIEKLNESQSNGNLSILCDIQPYQKNDLVADSNYLLTFLIIDSPGNKLAQELVIDFCRVKQIKIIYTVNSNTALVELLQTQTYPSLYQVKNYNQFTFLASGNSKTNFTNSINEVLETVHMTPFSIIDITTKLYNLLFSRNKLSKNENTVYLSDLEATLKYSLDHEIVSRNVISGEALNALNSYIELLIECFPSSTKGKKFIKLIGDNIRHNKSVTGEQLGNFVTKYELFLNPYVTKHNWIGCEGSHSMYRRYPCGLWTLFHTLTVQASTKNLNTFNGVQILETIAGYVKHYFGCTECSEHFLQMANSIKSNVSSLDDAVLWLWSAHNQVNQRLAGDVTEDPMHPKVLFPLAVDCETCRQNGTNEWNKIEVLKYLKKMYSTISIQQSIDDNTHPKLQNLVASKHIIDNENSDNLLNEEEWKIDINTCLISYILSCSVLMVLFYLLIVKNRCKKNKYIYFVLGKL